MKQAEKIEVVVINPCDKTFVQIILECVGIGKNEFFWINEGDSNFLNNRKNAKGICAYFGS